METPLQPCTSPSGNDSLAVPKSGASVLEALVGFAFLEAALWTDGKLRWQFSLGVMLWIAFWTLYRQPSARQLGVRWDGFIRSCWVTGVAAAIGAGLLAAGRLAGTLHPNGLHRSLYLSALGYLFWTLQQQFILQSFFFIRLEQWLGSRRAVWAAAGLFTVAHLPNPVLFPATLAAGLVFCAAFRRYRNIYTLAIAQAILGICLASAVPDAVHHHMRVGIGYLDWVAPLVNR